LRTLVFLQQKRMHACSAIASQCDFMILKATLSLINYLW
jgi:hypothetical protein